MSSATGLFKYFGTDADKLDRFVNGQVYLTPPKYFNDPWDFLVRCEPPTGEFLTAQVPSLHPAQMPEFHASVSTEDSLEEEARELQDGYSKQIGVVCLTELPVDRLMWAHYGDSHRGFVAEFECFEEGQSEAGFPLCATPFGPAAKLKYPPSLPVLKRDTSNMEETILTKHICWKYEQEWRVLWPLTRGMPHPSKKGYLLCPFQPTQLVRIILGLRVNKEVKSRLSDMLNRDEFKHVLREVVIIAPHSRELKSMPESW
jgi:Protein of unknown function (DUF2971)